MDVVNYFRNVCQKIFIYPAPSEIIYKVDSLEANAIPNIPLSEYTSTNLLSVLGIYQFEVSISI